MGRAEGEDGFERRVSGIVEAIFEGCNGQARAIGVPWYKGTPSSQLDGNRDVWIDERHGAERKSACELRPFKAGQAKRVCTLPKAAFAHAEELPAGYRAFKNPRDGVRALD